MQGTVERQQASAWTPISAHTWLTVGATVRTGDRSRGVFLMLDETQLKLNSNTELRLTSVRTTETTVFQRVAAAASRAQESVVAVTQGQVWLRARNKPANVTITTPSVTAAIRGTEFDLRVGADGASTISVLEGSVNFGNAQGTIVVNDGEQGVARVGQMPIKTILLNPSDAVQWTLVYSGAASARDASPQSTVASQDAEADARLLQRARLDLLSGDPAAARAVLEGVAPSASTYASVQALLSNVFLVQNRRDDARAAAERATIANPNSPSAYLALSAVERAAFDLPAALRAANRARRLDSAFAPANLEYATLLFGSGDTGGAEEIVRAVVADSPTTPLAHSTLGLILLARGRNRDAANSFAEALRLDSTLAEPHLGLGILAMRDGHPDAAAEEFIEAVTLEPRRSIYETYLAKALYELRRFDQAFAAIEAAARFDPRDPTPHLYAGIFANDLLQPGQAVRELEESIRLNQGRAVYRSQFLLDQDLATRNVHLAAAYARLGLSEWGNLRAIKSELADASSNAPHLFLADTFFALKGRLAAGSGELLLSRLLMPANANSFNALNNYTTLFDRTRASWSLSGTAGSFSSVGGSGNAAGGTNRLAYGASWSDLRSDGFRRSNDDSHSLFGAGLFKAALTPHSDVLLTYAHGRIDQGDHGGEIVNDSNSQSARYTIGVDRVEAGFHQQLRPGSNLVLYFARQLLTAKADDSAASADFHFSSDKQTPSNTYQAAHLLKISTLQLRYGLEVYQASQDSTTTAAVVLSRNPFEEFQLHPEVSNKTIRYRSGFAEARFSATADLSVVLGSSYDWANHDDFFLASPRSMSRWNPSAGVIYSPRASTTLRFAAMRVLQTHLQARIAPTQVAGFALNQNESPLTASHAYNIGWDQQGGTRTFVRTTAFVRNRTIPLGADCELVRCDGRLYGGGAVVNRFLTDRWTLVPQYSLTHANDLFGVRRDHEISVGTFYVHPRGYSFHAQEAYFHQRATSQNVPVSASVPTTDVGLSYESRHKAALISLSVTNLTDRRYAFVADPLALDTRVPRRQARITVQVTF